VLGKRTLRLLGLKRRELFQGHRTGIDGSAKQSLDRFNNRTRLVTNQHSACKRVCTNFFDAFFSAQHQLHGSREAGIVFQNVDVPTFSPSDAGAEDQLRLRGRQFPVPSVGSGTLG
jgi:hypothetical protein